MYFNITLNFSSFSNINKCKNTLDAIETLAHNVAKTNDFKSFLPLKQIDKKIDKGDNSNQIS